MDTNGKLRRLQNDRGMALVYVALMLVVLITVAGLAIDLGYMYVTKGQLQNAADSAALAGAGRLNGNASNPSYSIQTSARRAAFNFASSNRAATASVKISNDNSNSLSSANDIAVGNWNPARPKYPNDSRFIGGMTPINAVQARARRTSGADAAGPSIGGRVNLFLSKIIGQPTMGAAATAIAQRAARAGGYFLIGRNVCNQTISPSAPYVLKIDSQNVGNMAWTSLLSVPTAPGLNVGDLICGNVVPEVDVCANPLYTSQGQADTVYKDMEADFYDPNYDQRNKTFTTDNKGNQVVLSWSIIVPVAATDNPGLQPNPVNVYGYARIHIIKACGSGGGNPCNGNRPYTAPQTVCVGGEKDIVIDDITCVDCANSGSLYGATTVLVN